MNKERLLKLADFLENSVPDDQFDFSTIGFTHPVDCTFAGCAIGWMPDCFPEDIVGKHDKNIAGGYDICYKGYVTDKYQSFDTAMTYLELSHDEAGYLFEPELYPNHGNTTKEEVAERIREFVVSDGVYEKTVYEYESEEWWDHEE